MILFNRERNRQTQITRTDIKRRAPSNKRIVT